MNLFPTVFHQATSDFERPYVFEYLRQYWINARSSAGLSFILGVFFFGPVGCSSSFAVGVVAFLFPLFFLGETHKASFSGCSTAGVYLSIELTGLFGSVMRGSIWGSEAAVGRGREGPGIVIGLHGSAEGDLLLFLIEGYRMVVSS